EGRGLKAESRRSIRSADGLRPFILLLLCKLARVCDQLVAFLTAENRLIRGHLVLAFGDDLVEIGVRHLLHFVRSQIAYRQLFPFDRISASVGPMAYGAFPVVNI